MGSDVAPAPITNKDNAAMADTPASRTKRTPGKIPRRIHKAEREKLKREHLNDLFLELANSLDPNQQNNGKASTLTETTRLLKDLVGQIQCLEKENTSLLSESRYVTIEKNELKEENSILESQMEKLQSGIEARMAQFKPDHLNQPRCELQYPSSHFPCVDPSLQQPQQPTVLVVPLHSNLQGYNPLVDTTPHISKPASNISKPHARYPTASDSWPAQLLRD
jgi:hypothetical protein